MRSTPSYRLRASRAPSRCIPTPSKPPFETYDHQGLSEKVGTWARLLLLGLRLLLEAPSSAGDHWERLVEGCVGALDVLQDCCLGALLVHGHL